MEATDLAILAGVGLAYAMVSGRLGKTVVTSAIVFLTAGIVLGDAVLGWFTIGPSGATLRLIAESTLALVLFTDASRIDLRTLRRELAFPVRLLGIGLPLTIVAGVGAALLDPARPDASWRRRCWPSRWLPRTPRSVQPWFRTSGSRRASVRA